MSVVVFSYEKQASPLSATGRHAEVLAEISQAAELLIRYVAAEQSGTCDGFGQAAWVGPDPVANTVRRLANLVEQRNGTLRDAAATST
jgi:hypothetical protein